MFGSVGMRILLNVSRSSPENEAASLFYPWWPREGLFEKRIGLAVWLQTQAFFIFIFPRRQGYAFT